MLIVRKSSILHHRNEKPSPPNGPHFAAEQKTPCLWGPLQSNSIADNPNLIYVTSKFPCEF